MWVILRCMKSSFNFCRMMCVVINDGNAADLALVLKTTVCTCKASEAFDNYIIRKFQKASYGNGSQCVGNIVDARYTKVIAADFFALEENGEGRMSVFIPGDICGCIICLMLQTIGENMTWKATGNSLVFRCISIDDQSSVRRKKLSKFPEGMTDIVNILEEVQMVGIHVQDHADLREEAQEAVGIFTCFCDESFRVADTDIPVDGRKDSAYTDSGATVALKKDVGNHGSCGGFSVGTGNGDRCIVVTHDLAEKFRTCEHWEPFFFCTGKFRVVRMDRCCVDNHIDIIFDIGCTLSVVDDGTTFLECTCKRTGFGIGTGDTEVFLKKDLGKAAHADAADTDKMNMKRFMKVYLIHNNLLIYVIFGVL